MASNPKFADLPPGKSKRPVRQPSGKGPADSRLSPALKQWIDEVIVPALLKRYQRERAGRNGRVDST